MNTSCEENNSPWQCDVEWNIEYIMHDEWLWQICDDMQDIYNGTYVTDRLAWYDNIFRWWCDSHMYTNILVDAPQRQPLTQSFYATSSINALSMRLRALNSFFTARSRRPYYKIIRYLKECQIIQLIYPLIFIFWWHYLQIKSFGDKRRQKLSCASV